jgi:hypothetical protein
MVILGEIDSDNAYRDLAIMCWSLWLRLSLKAKSGESKFIILVAMGLLSIISTACQLAEREASRQVGTPGEQDMTVRQNRESA